jgi:hypothetical protein
MAEKAAANSLPPFGDVFHERLVFEMRLVFLRFFAAAGSWNPMQDP